jgi:hypothetical protein
MAMNETRKLWRMTICHFLTANMQNKCGHVLKDLIRMYMKKDQAVHHPFPKDYNNL